MLLYDHPAGPHPLAVRLFIEERGGLTLEVETIDLMAQGNRDPSFVSSVNPRGELPALRVSDELAITECTAICEYLDEVSTKPGSLLGDTPARRAVTRMWSRRVWLELIKPMLNFWYASEAATGFYRGHRILPEVSSQPWSQKQGERGLLLLDQQLQNNAFIAGNALSMADTLSFAFIHTMAGVAPWIERPDLAHYTRWRTDMAARPSVERASAVVNGTLTA